MEKTNGKEANEPKPEPVKLGRPTLYTPELAKEICHRIATGRDSLARICEADDMPNDKTVYRWLTEYEAFREDYARAREAQTEVYAQWMTDIAVNVPPINEFVQKAKLEIDTLKWIAAKLKPKKYGDGMILRGDKDNPLELGLAVALDSASTKRLELQPIEGELIQDASVPDPVPADDSGKQQQ